MIEFRPLASSSNGNCYYVSDGKTTLLLELGVKFKEIQKALRFKVSSVDAALVSHSHADHSKSVRDAMKAGIDVYASSGTFSALDVGGHRAHAIKSKRDFLIGSWRVLPFDVEHDADEPLGFLLTNKLDERLVFITDSYYCRYRFNGLNVVALEANYSLPILDDNIASGRVPHSLRGRLLRSHMSLETAKEFLQANDLSRVQEIHLMHLSDTNSDEELFKREIQKVAGVPVYVARR
ncbi:MBL fold metallo-hydrolase [Alicyclobacillus sp. SO9]|uniref:MBL fold metallo-hydrolase n=1 Tax=Alicyclobacillus sp. SO9 TaxID=2665646 RepID=UPI0018E8DAA6|nr:MBL fold metallo-hydrolase [Alicyclobacillus sp. SO9]QQE80893.1 MBL fold metallo-hydrolase [Alicyclobacillus sp. SO9]